MTQVAPLALDQVVQHAQSTPQAEVCGLLAGPPGPDRLCTAAIALANVQDRYHALDPVQFPRTSATAYRFNDMEHLKALKALEAQGLVVLAIYHSHIEVGAYFSEEDVVQALWEGAPRFPGVDYLVVGVSKGVAAQARMFRYQGGTFAGVDVALPGAQQKGGT